MTCVALNELAERVALNDNIGARKKTCLHTYPKVLCFFYADGKEYFEEISELFRHDLNVNAKQIWSSYLPKQKEIQAYFLKDTIVKEYSKLHFSLQQRQLIRLHFKTR